MKLRNTLAILFMALLFGGAALQAASPRMVLIEEATNASCAPCAGQNPTFKAFIENNRDNIIPLTYHWDFPGPNDPMFKENETMNNRRIEDYYNINGVPSCRVNGQIAPPSVGSWYAGAPGDTVAQKAKYEEYAGTSSPITIDIDEDRSGSNKKIKVTVSSDDPIQNKKLRVVLTEHHIFDPNAGSNGETDFHWVARDMLPDADGTTINLSAGGEEEFNFEYTMKSSWNPDQIYVIAFIQDDATKEVLQAAEILDIGGLQFAEVELEEFDNPYNKIARNGDLNKTIVVNNPNDFEVDVTLNHDTENTPLPSGYSISYEPKTFTLASDGTQEVTVTLTANTSNAYYSIVNTIAEASADGYEPKPDEVAFAALTDDAKYVVYSNLNAWAEIYNYVLQSTDYKKDLVYMPYNESIIQNYPVTDFDAAMFTIKTNLNPDNEFMLIPETMLTAINSMITSGKNVIIESDATGYFAFETSQAPANYKAFFENTLGITHNKLNQLYAISGDSYQIRNDLSVSGVSGNELTSDMSYTVNSFQQNMQLPAYGAFADEFSLMPNSEATPIMFYGGDESRIGGVMVEKGESKIVYVANPMAAHSNVEPVMRVFMKRVFDWFTDEGPQPEPEITISSSTVNFGEVEVDKSQEQSITITNEGDADLEVTDIDIFPNPDNVFSIENDSDITVQPGSNETITVIFTPKDTKEYTTGRLNISSNDPDDQSKIIVLSGTGTPATSVRNGKAVIDGLITLTATPNPVKETATVRFELGKAVSSLKINLLDAAGHKVAELYNNAASGAEDIKFNSSNLASGKYFITADVDGKQITLPVVVSK
ncbi:MAG: Omp28-related outer membrane protein [Candidatus Kapaibacterium sp.]